MRPILALSIPMFALASQAAAEGFASSPPKYAELVNAALQQVDTGLRIRQTSCTASTHCRFAARLIEVDVMGPADRPGTERILIAATFRQGDDEAATRLIDDTLTVLGATMVAYDPRMPADSRSKVLLELGDAALSVGEAHRDSADVHYALAFDDVSGRLEITAATLRAGHG